MKFSGKIALVTGAARGIGKTIAQKLNENGANVIITYYKNEESAKNLYNEIKYPNNLYIYHLNLDEKYSITTFIKEILLKYTKVDFLINNASYSENSVFGKSFFEYQWEDFLKPFEVDVIGGIMLLGGLVRKMIEQKFGRVIFFSSASAIKCDDVTLPFAVSKNAIIGVVRGFAKLLAPYGITVNAIAPGAIDTGWIEKWNVPKEWVEKTVSNTPVKRLGKPEDVAPFVLYLLSEQASYITGQVITIDGGAYL